MISYFLAEESIVQYAAVCRAQNNISCSEGRLNDSSHHDSMSKLCDDIASRIETKIKQQRDLLESRSLTSWYPLLYSNTSLILILILKELSGDQYVFCGAVLCSAALFHQFHKIHNLHHFLNILPLQYPACFTQLHHTAVEMV